MSNKGLTFLIIILLLLCGVTFGIFYLKTNPQLAMSQKIFGSADIAKMNLAKNDKLNSPFDNSSGSNVNTIPVENTVPTSVTNGDGTVITNGVSVTPEGTTNDTVVPNNSGVSTDTSSAVNTAPAAAATGPITLTLKVGSKGSQVKILQQFLIDNSYLTGKADGSFGNGTAAAVKKFQTEYNIKADGIVTGSTRTQINELLAV